MSDVVVSNDSKKKFNWRWVAVVAIVLVLALAAGAAARWWQQSKTADKEKQTAAAEETKASKAQDLAVSGNFEKSQQAIDSALKESNISADDKYQLYQQQGLNYENQQQYDPAIQSFKQAMAIKETNGIAEALARVYEAKGDNTQAIEYYRKAIALIPKDYPRTIPMKNYYNDSIVRLGGQP